MYSGCMNVTESWPLSKHENVTIRGMYEAMVPDWNLKETVDHILYWRAKSDGLTAKAMTDRTVQHLQRRCAALAAKIRGVRKAAIQCMQGRQFDIQAGLTEQALKMEALQQRVKELESK